MVKQYFLDLLTLGWVIALLRETSCLVHRVDHIRMLKIWSAKKSDSKVSVVRRVLIAVIVIARHVTRGLFYSNCFFSSPFWNLCARWVTSFGIHFSRHRILLISSLAYQVQLDLSYGNDIIKPNGHSPGCFGSPSGYFFPFSKTYLAIRWYLGSRDFLLLISMCIK